MKITSEAFQDGGLIPPIYTCEGKNISPPLHFHDIPVKAKSLVLLVDDPDVPEWVRPERMFDHWVVFNIPPHTPGLAEGKTPPGIEGQTTNGLNHYFGPCPPDGEHRYFFKLYALDQLLELPPGSTKQQVERAMEHHILQTAVLMGRYQKKQR